MNNDVLEQLLLDAVPLLNTPALTKCDDGYWCISFKDALVVDVEMDEESSRMAFFADLGPLPEQNRSTLMEMMLTYNYLWNVHGGLRIGLDESRQNVVLIFDISLSDLTVQQLALVISNFRHAASGWRDHLAAPATEMAGGDGSSALDSHMAGLLKV